MRSCSDPDGIQPCEPPCCPETGLRHGALEGETAESLRRDGRAPHGTAQYAKAGPVPGIT